MRDRRVCYFIGRGLAGLLRGHGERTWLRDLLAPLARWRRRYLHRVPRREIDDVPLMSGILSRQNRLPSDPESADIFGAPDLEVTEAVRGEACWKRKCRRDGMRCRTAWLPHLGRGRGHPLGNG